MSRIACDSLPFLTSLLCQRAVQCWKHLISSGLIGTSHHRSLSMLITSAYHVSSRWQHTGLHRISSCPCLSGQGAVQMTLRCSCIALVRAYPLVFPRLLSTEIGSKYTEVYGARSPDGLRLFGLPLSLRARRRMAASWMPLTSLRRSGWEAGVLRGGRGDFSQ